ncbi:L,D-transpeptidase family protein [Reyranella sp.]|uniref:L,D-transpeptidase family protein n=1 Tax=Reyranella sp. TaxID=1929291 RepID=UPI0034407F63
MKLFNGDDVVRQWPAVSGTGNFGSPKDQEKKGRPIPEGTYDIKQERYQEMDWLRRQLGGGLRWPGGTRSWGTERVWADPTKEAIANGLTFGRKDMAIHGGDVPGSVGCIDLTTNMNDFAKTFRGRGADLKLYVDYNPPVPENGLNRSR